MVYFSKFETIQYKFGDSDVPVDFTNLSQYVDIIDQFKDDATVYETYTLSDGERPDVVSYRLYATTDHYWTFYLLNDGIRQSGWPLSSLELIDHIKEESVGQVLVSSGSSVGATTGFTQPTMTDKFPVGTDVHGSSTGAFGKVYARDVSLGQIFVTSENGILFGQETIKDVLSGAPNHQLDLDSASETINAVHHFEDSDGNIVDIDPISGIDAATLTPVTFKEFFTNRNDDLSSIRVLRKNVVGQFASLFREAITS